MDLLTFLHTPSNSKIADMYSSILLSVIHDEINTGSYFVQTATNGGDIQVSDFSFLPGTIQNTFDIDANQFVTYIN